MARRSPKPEVRGAPWPGHALSPAWLSMLPMFACYELAVRQYDGARRNGAEVLLSLWLSPLGEWADGVRLGLIAAFTVVALHLCRRHGVRVRESLARIWLESCVAALTLGPALVGVTALWMRWTDQIDVAWDSSRSAPELGTAALVFGGSVYEELVFRIGLYGLLYWTLVRALRLLKVSERPAIWGADLLALTGSALGFAAFHFRRFTYLLWEGGAAFTWPAFLWLASAGLLLGILYRMRGPGVAAGAHALFNLGLLIGIDPDVLT